MKQFNITRGVKGSIHLHNYLMRVKYVMDKSVKEKTKILKFENKHGIEATLDAFGVGRSTVYLWKKQLKENNGKVEVLKNKSKGIKNHKASKVSKKTIDYIKDIRNEKGKIGKEKIAYLLKENGIDNISASTIGRILNKLKEKNLIDKEDYKVRLNGGTGRLTVKKCRKTRNKRLIDKHFSKVKESGHFQIDTIVEIRNGIRKYIIQAIDVYNRISFSYAYGRALSISAKDFFIKLKEVLPYPIKRVQVDNGSEFAKHFSEHLKSLDIPIFKTYPRTPKMNAKVERLNRTTQEEFYLRHKSLLWDDIEMFNRKLIKWLWWYNTSRPHWSLNLLSPLDFFCMTATIKKLNVESNLYRTNAVGNRLDFFMLYFALV